MRRGSFQAVRQAQAWQITRRAQSAPRYAALGDAESDFKARVRALDAAAKSVYRWPQGVTEYPTQYVADVMKVLASNVLRPFYDTKRALLADKSNIGVASEISDTGAHLERAWLDLQAEWAPKDDEAIRTGAKTMKMPRLRDQVIAVVNGAYAAWYRWAYLEGIKPWFMQLGPVVDGVISALAWLGKRAQELATLVPNLPSLPGLDTLMLWSVIGVGAWLLLRKPPPAQKEA